MKWKLGEVLKERGIRKKELAAALKSKEVTVIRWTYRDLPPSQYNPEPLQKLVEIINRLSRKCDPDITVQDLFEKDVQDVDI